MTDELLKAVMSLPPEERVELADRLLLSVKPQGHDPAEVEAAWAEEIERRMKRMDEGLSVPVPWEIAKSQMYEEFKRRTGK